jgi:hypothetical protein
MYNRDHTVRLKRGMEGKTRANISTGFIREREPAEGSPARELESTATYRIGVEIGV